MLDILKTRLRQKHRTIAFPASPPELPDRFRGLPVLDPPACGGKCATRSQACAAACPVSAISVRKDGPPGGRIRIDLGRCIFCGDCVAACPTGAIRFTNDYRLAVRSRAGLMFSGDPLRLADAVGGRFRRLFGRSLKLRQVSAGGCNACEADINVLTTVVFDLGRFGIQIVASPRHADGLLITGPVSAGMRDALLSTYEAVPDPKLVIAVGACAISGGLYAGRPEVCNGADPLMPVDLYIPGCPPHPITILDGMLRLLGKLENR